MIPARLAFSVTYRLARTACNPVVVLLILLIVLVAIPTQSGAETRIVAFGDSLTAGYGVAQGDGLVPQLQRWLDTHGALGVEVVDSGVTGDTTAGGRARLEWAMAFGTKAVILELGANDMLRGVDPSETRANLDAMLAALAARDLPVLLVGMRSTSNFGFLYKRAFDAIYPDLAQQYDTLFYPFFFEGVIGKPGYFLNDRLHPNAAGIARIVDRLGPLVLELIDRIER